MKLSDLGEHGLIARVTRDCPQDPSRVVRGVGDDCSVTRLGDGRLQLVTTDMLVEEIHFLRDAMSGLQLGAKAMAVNVSDIAAMGGSPCDAWISIALPTSAAVAWVDDVFSGIRRMADEHGINILGGDTTRAHRVVINIVVLGEVSETEVLLRSGARARDRIFVSGSLGDSAAGLDALRHQRDAAELVRRHLEPEPHVRIGRRLASSGQCHAAIDISDGLASDLNHICAASDVGCVVDSERLPLSEELRAYCAHHELDPLSFALRGGEDYVLLATGDPQLADLTELVDVGEITAERACVLVGDGATSALEPAGWDHLR